MPPLSLQFLHAIAAKGGKVRSIEKAAACRLNGIKSGKIRSIRRKLQLPEERVELMLVLSADQRQVLLKLEQSNSYQALPLRKQQEALANRYLELVGLRTKTNK